LLWKYLTTEPRAPNNTPTLTSTNPMMACVVMGSCGMASNMQLRHAAQLGTEDTTEATNITAASQ